MPESEIRTLQARIREQAEIIYMLERRYGFDRLREAFAEALDIFDATWCPEHGHAPNPKQHARVAELRKVLNTTTRIDAPPAPVFVVVCHDRHVDDQISVHATRASADLHVEAFKTLYAAEFEEHGLVWHERNYGAPKWVRCVQSHDDGPSARIEVAEMVR